MPIPFTCPKCGKYTMVADQFAGHTGPCAGCGEDITIPNISAAESKKPSVAATTVLPIVLFGVIALGLVAVVGALVFLPAVQSARSAARNAQGANNMKQIALAFHNYHDAYGTLPPAYIADENGTPMHSWRVLILPFIDAQPQYNMYNFDKPWDAPENSGLRQMMMSIYVSPNSANSTPTETNYVVINGQGSVFDGDKAVNFGAVTDGTSNTALFIEVRGTGIEWSEPRDLDLKKLALGLQDGTIGATGVVQIAYADGSVRTIPKSQAVTMLQDLALMSNGK